MMDEPIYAKTGLNGQKTDNKHPGPKLELRAHFLEKYHADGQAEVMDCCQGDGLLWKTLRKHFPVKSYWGLDLKKKKGRLMIDSVRVLMQRGWTQNVIDVDTYGQPWKHWNYICANLTRPTTVFLTVGHCGPGLIAKIPREALGLPERTPPGLAATVVGLSHLYCIFQHQDKCKVIELAEAEKRGSAAYYGVRIEPLEAAAAPPAQPVESAPRKNTKRR